MMLSSYISISRNRLFVWSALAVLFLFISLHVVYFEIFSRQIVKNDLSKKRFHLIQKEGASIKVSAIGTSHTSDSLKMNEEYFFNYARSGTWYPQVAYSKVSHLLKYASNLKVLLLEVDHISLLGYNHLLHSHEPDQYLYLLKHVNELLYEEERITTYNKSTFLLSLQEDVAPVIHRKYFQSYLIGRGRKKEVSVWATLTAKEKILRAKKRTRSYQIDTPSKIDKAVRDYYVKAIREAKKRGVKVYLLFNPQTKEYFSEINAENNIEVDKFVSTLSINDNVYVLDYRHLFDTNESYFANQDHLNRQGSEILTQKVVGVIEDDI